MDPLAQYATESDVHGRGQGPQPASRKQVRDDDEPARWWQDMHLVATTGVAQLDVGPTAYRLIGEKGRVVVLLHGAFSFSYIFLDLVTRLSAEDASSPLAGQAAKRFLLFDFLGRGRTPWPSSNPPCTCELLRTQLEQLLSYLNLGSDKVVLIGHDMGSLVGANFAAKNPERVFGFIALGPAGTRRHRQIEELVASGSAGNLFWHDNDEHLSSLLDRLHRADFYDQDVTSRHGSLINLHCAMIRWQIENTEGYLPAVKSTLRFFPLCEHTRREAPGAISDALESILGKPQPTSGLSILREVALGAHRTVVVWGSKDTLYPPELGEDGLKGALPGADIVYMSCGHALLLENYRETAREVKIRLLTFWSEDESGMNPSTGSIDTRNELAAVAAKECDRVQVAEALVACLQPPHYFATVLSALSQAQRLGMQGALVEEVARIVLYQSRARLLQQSIQICIDHDDIPTLVEVIHNGRLYFLKGVEGYAPCHCRCCSQWAVDLDSMDAYIASRQKVRTLQEVQNGMLAEAAAHAHGAQARSTGGLSSPPKSPGSSFEKSESKARRSAGWIAMGSAKLPNVDFDVEAAGAMFDLLDVDSMGYIRAHELVALTSLLDADPATVELLQNSLHTHRSGAISKDSFISLYRAHLSALIRQHPRAFELALSACLPVAHRYYHLSSD